MNKLLAQIRQFTDKYGHYINFVVANMRLVLLVTFGVLCSVLALQVNGIIDESNAGAPDTSQSISSKKPDASVISVFNELQTQDVQVSSQFDANRNNPF